MTDDAASGRSLPHETVERAVAAMAPDWRVRAATLADEGHTAVYHVELDAAATAGGDAAPPASAVLKATPPDEDFAGVHVEPRLLALVADRTSIPVPAVYGVLDDSEGLPTPCFLMAAVDDDRHVADHRELAADALARLARTTGRYLAELHALDVVDRFGTVAWTGDGALDGAAPDPTACASELAVVDGADDWLDVLADWVALECRTLADTRFADHQSTAEAMLGERLDALRAARDRGDVAFDPVLARIDHGLHNVVLAGEAGAVAGVIDWAFTLATTRAYDLAVVADVLTGGVRALRPDHPDRRDRVEAALLAGYRQEAGFVPDEYHEHGGLYEALAAVRGMNHFERVLEDAPPDRRDAAAAALRARVDDLA